MTIGRIFNAVTLLALLLISACTSQPPTEMVPDEEPIVPIEEVLPIVNEPVSEPTLFHVSENSALLESQTVITRENAHAITQVGYLGKGNINDIAWSPSGSPIALATTTGIYLIDPQTFGEKLFSTTSSNHITFSPDGTLLASAEGSRGVLRDLENGSEQLVLEGHSDKVYMIAFSPADNLLATASQDGTIRLWDLSSEDELQSLEGPGTFVHDIAFSADGKTLVSAAYSQHPTITLWDVVSGKEITKASEISGTAFAVSPAGNLIAVGGYNAPLHLIDFNGQINLTLDEEPKPVLALSFSPDGKILASSSDEDPDDHLGNSTLKLWDTTSGELVHTHEEEGNTFTIAFSPDGSQLVTASPEKVKLWDIKNGKLITTLTDQPEEKAGFGTGSIDDFAWSPDGKTLTLATFKGIDVINLQTHEEIHFDLDEDGFFHGDNSITLSPNGDFLAVSFISFKTRGFVNIYDIRTEELLFTLDDFDEDTFGIAFNHDNSILATGWGNTWGFSPGGVKLWDVSTGDLIDEYDHEGMATIYNLTFNQEGNLLAAISGEGHVYIWDVNSGQEIQHFQGTGGFGYAVAFSPDSKRLAVGGAEKLDDGTTSLRLINLNTEEIIFDLKGHENWYVGSVEFNADGSVLVSASQDGTVRLWDTQTGEQLAVLDIPGATSVGFSPDGTFLATAGYRDVLRLWGVP